MGTPRCRPKDKPANLIGESAVLYTATCAAVLVKFLGGFIMAAVLGPALYGLRTVLNLIIEYEHYSQAGTFTAMTKEVPYCVSREDWIRAKEIENNVFSVNIIYAAVVGGMLCLLATYLSQNDYETIYVQFTGFLAVHIILTKVRLFYEFKLVIDKKSSLLSVSRVIYQSTAAVFSVILAYLYGLFGWFVGVLIADSITATLLLCVFGKIPHFQVSLQIIWQLIKVGLPIMLIGLTFLFLTSIDRILVGAMLSNEMLGYFGIATIVGGMIYLTLLDVVGVIMFPRMMERLGASGRVSKLKNYLVEPTVLVSYLVPLVIGAAFLSIHLPLMYLLPEYSQAIGASKILLLSSFFFCVVGPALLVCVALNKQLRMLCLTLGAVILNGIFSYLSITIGWGIDGVAAGTGFAYFVFSTIVIGYALNQFGAPAAEYMRFFGIVYTPFVYATILLLMLEAADVVAVDGVWTDVISTAVKVVAFSAAFLLILIPIRKDRAFVRLSDKLPVFCQRLQHRIV